MWMYNTESYWDNKDILEEQTKRILEHDDRNKKYDTK